MIGLEAPTVREEPAEGSDDGEPPARPTSCPLPRAGPRERSLAIGNAVHAALEASARRSWAPPDGAELEAILARAGLDGDGEARERVEALVEGWLASELRAELEASGARIRPEVPFVLGLGGAVVRGKIDLLAELPEGPLVVDYKTDALARRRPGRAGGALRDAARPLRARRPRRAPKRGGGDRSRRLLLPRGPRARRRSRPTTRPGLAAARERLERLVAGIRAGDFERTDNPHPALCYGCPAAARLCAKPAWRPQWATSSARPWP